MRQKVNSATLLVKINKKKKNPIYKLFLNFIHAYLKINKFNVLVLPLPQI